MLIKSLDILCVIITYELIYFTISKMNEVKSKFSLRKFIIILCVAIMNYLFARDSFILVKLTISFISLLILSISILGRNESKIISTVTLYFVISLIVEIALSIILTPLLNHKMFQYIISRSILKGILSVVAAVVILGISSIKRVKSIKNKLEIFHENLNISKSFFVIIISSMMIILCFYIKNIINTNNILYLVLYLICIFFIIFYFFYSLYRNYYLKTLNHILEDRDKNYEKLLNEYKMFKHNIRNELVAIRNVGNKKTKEAINNYLEEFSIINGNSDFINNMPNDIKGIIFKNIIEGKNINVYSENYLKTNIIDNLSLMNYCKFIQSFGIIVDNAFDYLKSSKSRNIFLIFSEDEKYYLFRCINELDSLVDVSIINDLKKSSKSGHMGVGLKYIKTKTSFILNILIRNNQYIAMLKVKKKS